MNNTILVLSALKRRQRGLTQAQASELGIYRLAARIYDLRRQGYEVTTVTERGLNQLGNPCKWARYVLMGNGS